MESPRWTDEERPQGTEGMSYDLYERGPQDPETTFQKVPEVGAVLSKRKMGLAGESEGNEEWWEVETEQPQGQQAEGLPG